MQSSECRAPQTAADREYADATNIHFAVFGREIPLPGSDAEWAAFQRARSKRHRRAVMTLLQLPEASDRRRMSPSRILIAGRSISDPSGRGGTVCRLPKRFAVSCTVSTSGHYLRAAVRAALLSGQGVFDDQSHCLATPLALCTDAAPDTSITSPARNAVQRISTPVARDG
jgi:hypothetical protein